MPLKVIKKIIMMILYQVSYAFNMLRIMKPSSIFVLFIRRDPGIKSAQII